MLQDPGLADESFAGKTALGIMDFSGRYPSLGLSEDEIKSNLHLPPSELMSLFLCNFALQAVDGEKICVIIDDYDRFAGFLAKGPDACASQPSSAQCRLDLIKAFYATLKQFFGLDDGSKPIERIFITGVTAVSIDSLVLGFNIAANINDLPGFNAMAGFTCGELSQMVDEAVDFKALKRLSKAGVMEAMENNFGGYAFSENGSGRIFYPASCQSFMGMLSASGSIQEASKAAG